jgi:predicted dienelactone hydrolase
MTMQPFEILLVLAILIAPALRVAGARFRVLAFAALLVAAVALVLHTVLEGPHWQMAPAYAAFVVLLVAYGRMRSSAKVRLAAGAVVAVLCGIAAVCSYLLPMFRLPKPTGSYAVGTRTLFLVDASRAEDASSNSNGKRELMVQVWYPAAPGGNPIARYRPRRETTLLSSYLSMLRTNSYLDAPVAQNGEPFPILLFNPAWEGGRAQNTFLTEDLASHGYVVVSIDHPYNAHRVAFPDGRIVDSNASWVVGYPDSSTPDEVKSDWNKELVKWVADNLFVLNQLAMLNGDASSPWYGRLNTNLVGAVGHSFGGSASMGAAVADARIKSAINMDGWIFNGLTGRTAKQQIMVMYEAIPNVDPLVRLPSTATVSEKLDHEDFTALQHSVTQYGGFLIGIKGVQHMDFTDKPLFSPLRRISGRGNLPTQRIQQIVRAYVLNFFDETLRGEKSPLLDREGSPFPEAKYQQWGLAVQAQGASRKSDDR